MHCSGLNALPTLPNLPLSTSAGVQELVVEDSNIATMWMKMLYNKYHMSSLQRMELTYCKMQTIEDEAFYDMSRLKNLNLRCIA